MALKLRATKLFSCVLNQRGIPKKYLPDIFLTKGEANLYAKTYLSLRRKKSLSVMVEEHSILLGPDTKSPPS